MPARDAARAGRTTGLARIKAWCCATGGPRRGAERRTPVARRCAMRDAPSGTRHAAHNAGAADAPAHGAPASRPNNTAARCDRASRARLRVTHRGRPSQPRIAAITRFTAGARTPAGRRRFEQAPARSATLRPDAARRAPPSRAGRPLANSPAESAD
ncbi:hypothetical protein [Burkholderia pseudomallei]|uniref:hypothetical protein n=1 Tax=Burkholderia pseudomallei TaxID=28450 RepID=UPI001869125C|nr:hypothetical protein [Burkholderia pseudomallei]MBF3521932.1 hypothetical protein [Burkholderia pseudomallei]MBF3573138.1 hypothetical protein [Burkholderia pseudomallei]MBO3051495.1 hypothetical protein [Burkholderia pseudomallei]QTB58809.1 hypothetical protein J3E55_21465 [Burkholderia pseudomallei]